MGLLRRAGVPRLILVAVLVAAIFDSALANDIDPFGQFGCPLGLTHCEKPYLSMEAAAEQDKVNGSDFNAIAQAYMKGWLALRVGEYGLAKQYLNGAFEHAEVKCDQHIDEGCDQLHWLIAIHLVELYRDTKQYADVQQLLGRAKEIYKGNYLHQGDFEDVALMALLAGDVSMSKGEYESALGDYLQAQQLLLS